MRAALRTIYGVGDAEEDGAAPRRVQVAGRTDLEIAREIAEAGGVPRARFEERLGDFREAAVREYERRAPDDLSGRVAEGVRELLANLGQREDVICSLLTGNLEPIARLKLARAGIGGYFAAGQGAFGSDAEDRLQLPAIARRRAGNDGSPHDRARTVVIGDTPRDIACARADGLRCLAVATGPYAVEELRQADAVAERASELPELLAALDRSERWDRDPRRPFSPPG